MGHDIEYRSYLSVSHLNENRLYLLEWISLVSVLLAWWITAMMIDAGVATEANPLTDAGFNVLGFWTTGAVALVAVVLLFSILYRLETDYAPIPTIGAGLIAAIQFADAARNSYFMLTAEGNEWVVTFSEFLFVQSFLLSIGIATLFVAGRAAVVDRLRE